VEEIVANPFEVLQRLERLVVDAVVVRAAEVAVIGLVCDAREQLGRGKDVTLILSGFRGDKLRK
jgi:hypothetical protein